MTAIIRWSITDRPDGGADVYELHLDDGRCRVRRGEHGEPKLTIAVDALEFVRLAAGLSNPMQSYFSGRTKLGGDIMLAAKLSGLFRIPGVGGP